MLTMVVKVEVVIMMMIICITEKAVNSVLSNVILTLFKFKFLYCHIYFK